MIIRLNHFQISIPKDSETEARAFYCDCLGLKEIPKPESLKGRGGFWCELGDIQIHFGSENGVDRAATKAHPAFEVHDLNFWRQRLKEMGIEPQEGIPIPHFDRFECRDPFGNRLEFMERT